jgi:hypothetical protein
MTNEEMRTSRGTQPQIADVFSMFFGDFIDFPDFVHAPPLSAVGAL